MGKRALCSRSGILFAIWENGQYAADQGYYSRFGKTGNMQQIRDTIRDLGKRAIGSRSGIFYESNSKKSVNLALLAFHFYLLTNLFLTWSKENNLLFVSLNLYLFTNLKNNSFRLNLSKKYFGFWGPYTIWPLHNMYTILLFKNHSILFVLCSAI